MCNLRFLSFKYDPFSFLLFCQFIIILDIGNGCCSNTHHFYMNIVFSSEILEKEKQQQYFISKQLFNFHIK